MIKHLTTFIQLIFKISFDADLRNIYFVLALPCLAWNRPIALNLAKVELGRFDQRES